MSPEMLAFPFGFSSVDCQVYMCRQSRHRFLDAMRIVFANLESVCPDVFCADCHVDV